MGGLESGGVEGEPHPHPSWVTRPPLPISLSFSRAQPLHLPGGGLGLCPVISDVTRADAPIGRRSSAAANCRTLRAEISAKGARRGETAGRGRGQPARQWSGAAGAKGRAVCGTAGPRRGECGLRGGAAGLGPRPSEDGEGGGPRAEPASPGRREGGGRG